jgi:hypothetical protein
MLDNLLTINSGKAALPALFNAHVIRILQPAIKPTCSARYIFAPTWDKLQPNLSPKNGSTLPDTLIHRKRYPRKETEHKRWRQPTGTTAGKKPHFKSCKIHHVDVLAWTRRLRIAPSRTSPISTVSGRQPRLRVMRRSCPSDTA